MSAFDALAAGLNDVAWGTFGDAALYLPADGEAQAIRVIVRRPTQEVTFGQAGFRGTAWAADVLVSEVAAPQRGDMLDIDGLGSFKIGDVTMDGAGQVNTLTLKPTT